MMKVLKTFTSNSGKDFEVNALVNKQDLLDQGLTGEEIIANFDDGYDAPLKNETSE